jgi:glycosyltransferase involved in cell wall biosynthesis
MKQHGAVSVAPTALPRAPGRIVDVVVPVYNEERDLGPSIRRLREFLDTKFPLPAMITIADNASRDGTLAIAEQLSRELTDIRVLHLDAKGRGRALRAAWLSSPAPVVAYMDVDLSTDLGALHPLVAPLAAGESDVAIGSRLARGAQTRRGFKREFISRGYMLVLRLALGVRFTDAQCGFKALRTEVARQIVPKIEDQTWFFDTELLVIAQRAGFRVHEVPVKWTDDPDSRVDIIRTAIDDLRGVARLRFGLFRAPKS